MPIDKNGKIIANWGEQDILGLPEASDWSCRLGAYRGKERRLRVLVNYNKKVQQPYEIRFNLAEYFEGPLSWVGASLSVGTADELLNLYRRLDKDITDNGEKSLREGNFGTRLYRFDTKFSRFTKSIISIILVANSEIHIQKL